MLNGSRGGLPKTRVPQPKVPDVHREIVNDRAKNMAEESRVPRQPAEDVGAFAHPQEAVASVRIAKPLKKGRGPKSSQPPLRALISVPITVENNLAYQSVLASAPESERAGIQRRLILRARDSMMADESLRPFEIPATEVMLCRIRLEPKQAKKICEKVDPLGIRSQQAVLGSALAPYLHEILSKFPRVKSA